MGTKTPPTVMVIEDDAHSSYLMGRYARTCGCRSVNLRYGEDAPAFARQVRPALILLDLGLPGISGWEVLQTLKADPVTEHIPVIICSARNETERAQLEGAAGYLQKPIYYEDFLKVLKEAGIEVSLG
jgi:CheY-like chemotaxis protein